jgi:hypothetical protein
MGKPNMKAGGFLSELKTRVLYMVVYALISFPIVYVFPNIVVSLVLLAGFFMISQGYVIDSFIYGRDRKKRDAENQAEGDPSDGE